MMSEAAVSASQRMDAEFGGAPRLVMHPKRAGGQKQSERCGRIYRRAAR